LSSDIYKELLQTLRLSDAVKYAKFTPDKEESDQSMETIRKTIDAIERR
jgi:hypothetical protein